MRNYKQTDPWRNGSASDSRSEGCVFDSRRVQSCCFYFLIFSWAPNSYDLWNWDGLGFRTPWAQSVYWRRIKVEKVNNNPNSNPESCGRKRYDPNPLQKIDPNAPILMKKRVSQIVGWLLITLVVVNELFWPVTERALHLARSWAAFCPWKMIDQRVETETKLTIFLNFISFPAVS